MLAIILIIVSGTMTKKIMMVQNTLQDLILFLKHPP